MMGTVRQAAAAAAAAAVAAVGSPRRWRACIALCILLRRQLRPYCRQERCRNHASGRGACILCSGQFDAIG